MILTEEELNKNIDYIDRVYKYGSPIHWDVISSLLQKVAISHRNLLSANAELSFKNMKLTEENNKALTKEDILYTLSSISTALEENEKLRKALKDVWEVDTSDWEEAVRKQYLIIETALEELK